MRRVKITIWVDTDATDDQIHEVATDAFVQLETLEDEHGVEISWSDYEVKIGELLESQ